MNQTASVCDAVSGHGGRLGMGGGGEADHPIDD
jgi:hypothetical protein